MIFKDRTQAGIELAQKVKRYAGEAAMLLAIPRGGVPVACAIAREIPLPLQLLYVKKLGHPRDREYAIGAVGLEDSYLLPNAGIGDRYISLETAQIRKRLEHMRAAFGFDELPLRNKTLIIVDDGIATGATLTYAIRLLRKKQPAAIVVATPVASREAAIIIGKDADAFISVQTINDFTGVGAYYHDFHQLDDEEVLADIQRLSTESASLQR